MATTKSEAESMSQLFEEIKKRRLVEWMVAYVAGAILLLEVIGALASRWPITDSALRGIEVSVGIGFLLALVLAWHHGPRGRQEPSGPELLILTFLLLLASLLLALVVDEPFVAPEGGERGDVGVSPLRPPSISARLGKARATVCPSGIERVGELSRECSITAIPARSKGPEIFS